MKRKTVRAVLTAYREIDKEIENQLLFALDKEIENQLLFARESGEDKYKKEAAELRAVKKEIVRALNAIPPKERNALWHHYIMGWTWTRVAMKFNYSERQIRNISNRGLDRLAKTFSQSPEIAAFCARSGIPFI